MIELREEPVSDLREHAAIPSVFGARSIFEVRQSSTCLELVEWPIAEGFCKNYDHFESPLRWSHKHDTKCWVLIAASLGSGRVVGIIVAADTDGVTIFEGELTLRLCGTFAWRGRTAESQWLPHLFVPPRIGRVVAAALN